MVEEFVGAYGSRLVIAVVGVGIGFVCLIGVLWLLRGRGGPSPFVRGGRNRNPRLQVLDAAAVDTRRRLVLVRRDDVEHLIMIGGPTDIVIESRIGAVEMQAVGSNAPAALPIAPPSIGESPLLAEVAERPRARPAPEARIEKPRQETLRSEPSREPPALPVRPIAEPAAVQTAPAAPIASVSTGSRPEPVAAPAAAPISASALAGLVRPEPVARPLPDMSRPVQPVPNRGAEPAPVIDDAANALEAARGRVLTEQPKVVAIAPSSVIAPAPTAQGPTAQAAAATQPVADRPKALGSDFEKILEEEMAQNLAAREAAQRPNRQTLPRDPAVPPVAAPRTDPSLQDEVARIFGEMSATRDK